MKFLLGIIFLSGIAGAQTGTPTMLLLSPEGERLSRFTPEIGNYRDSVLTGMHGISAIRFNDFDTSFYVVASGTSNGHGACILRFGASKVQQQQITSVDSMLFNDGSQPSDMVFFSALKAYVCLRGKQRIQIVAPHAHSGEGQNFIPLPGLPRGIERVSLSRTIVTCVATDTDAGADSSHILLINTDVDSVIGKLTISGIAQWCVRDQRFKLHVLSREGTDHAVITVVDDNLHVDTTYTISGDYSAISATAAVDTNYARIILSNGSKDSLASQYNPLTKEVYKRLGPRGLLSVGFGAGIITVEPGAISNYSVALGGAIVINGTTLIPPASFYSAFLDVAPVSLGVEERTVVQSPELAVSVSPQPCSTGADVTVTGTHTPRLQMFDCLGRCVHLPITGADSKWRFDTSQITPGIYYAVVQDGTRRRMCPLTVMR